MRAVYSPDRMILKKGGLAKDVSNQWNQQWVWQCSLE